MKGLPSLTVVLLAIAAAVVPAQAAVINFDGLADLDPVTTQFAGLTFTNATVATAGLTLNEFDFPPHSGDNVVFDDGGPVTILFAKLQASVGGFFNYSVLLTFTAFDANDDPAGVDTSDFGSNLAVSGEAGSSPNEFLGVAFAAGIRRVTIEGDVAGDSFTLDDLTFTPVNQVPGPTALLLVVLGALAVLASSHARRSRDRSHL